MCTWSTLRRMHYDSAEQLLMDDKTIDMVVTKSGLQIDTYILEPSVKIGAGDQSPAKCPVIAYRSRCFP